jgi:hypothetical protein
MTNYEKLLGALAGLGISSGIIVAVAIAFLTARPGGEELDACRTLLEKVGAQEYQRLLNNSTTIDRICGDFNLA